MNKIRKNSRRGFTLVEMVLVIAIIVILAAVMLIGLGNYIAKSRRAASELERHLSQTDSIVAVIDAQVADSIH